ncbi:MAG: hypothetical protein U9R57_04460 [Thermodesulfobacteriota bacterium]|nr:hypothetical protein [Thermodesulfobacteriota bacterium]
MTCKKIVFFLSVGAVAGLGFLGLPVDNTLTLQAPSLFTGKAETCTVEIQLPEWLIASEAIASPYRRSVRRTARRTARRTTYRHNSY